MSGAVRYEASGPVARVTLARPPLNVLDIPTLRALDATLARVEADPALAIVVLRSEIPRAFSAGTDVADHAPEKVGEMLSAFHAVLRRLLSWDRVSIAVVRGLALGGGCELAAACDLIVADDTAEFGQPEIGIGFFPPAAAAILPGLIGASRAADLVLSGRRVKAAEAKAIGLVCDVVPAAKSLSRWGPRREAERAARGRGRRPERPGTDPGWVGEDLSGRERRHRVAQPATAAGSTEMGSQLDAAVDAFVAEFCTRSPAVLRAARAAVAATKRPVLEALDATERVYRERLVPLADMREGLRAFLEKRAPRWEGR